MKPDTLRLLFAAIALAMFASAAAAAAAPAIADLPIALDTPTGQILGSLVMPAAAKGPVPVALIIAGSGPTDRNGNSRMLPGANNSLMLLAQALGEAGFAAVRYDKRGIAASLPAGASEAALRFDTYVDDAAAWVAMLRRDARFSSVIVIGHSEGSLIGMLAAKRSGASAYVSLAGVARAASDVLRTQLAGKLPPELAAQNEAILVGLEKGQVSAGVPKELAGLYRESVQPYLISWFKYVPAQRIGMLDVPVLIAQGSTDIQVAVSEAEALKQALPRARLVLIPGMNHVLKMVD
ncbi:MAG: alpha/beta fold hydrolase, partial [Pseudomonadota bacterium]|nr:alpha/beta fold hydrolase [Pseudomonadota bacterium]